MTELSNSSLTIRLSQQQQKNSLKMSGDSYKKKGFNFLNFITVFLILYIYIYKNTH